MKTVSFSTTVSELMLPAIEPPKEEKRFQGEYVETYFGDPDGVKEDAPGPNYVELAAKGELFYFTKSESE